SIHEALGAGVCLIAYGSGNSEKTRILLQHLGDLAAYMPIDISREHLIGAAKDIATDFPRLEVLPVCADFSKPIALPTPRNPVSRKVVFFPGSTIGNFHPEQATEFLRGIKDSIGADGGLLIGVDVPKSRARLELAYDDPEGVTARFNLNMLEHINRTLGTDFDLGAFKHRAVWNEDASRVEMHLVSTRAQGVRLGEHRFQFQSGETIWTESSYKYSLERFRAVAEAAGLVVDRVWQDPRQLFSVQLLSPRAA
ncbi:MAG: L-histidine N(alpha)-methyltransferase, partial [Gammaproteobacteria bacterium]|nr:L-histidine N(alpha)-methyltransferase [Gammaproteobacteria bacterium]